MKNLSEKGFAQLLIIGLLVIGVLATVFLVQKQQTLKSKASNDPITFQDNNGNFLPKANGIAQTADPRIHIAFFSPIGPSQTSSSTTSTNQITTKFYQFSENPGDLNHSPDPYGGDDYIADPSVRSLTLTNIAPGGKKFFWAKFTGSDGSTQTVGPYEVDLVDSNAFVPSATTIDPSLAYCDPTAHPCTGQKGVDHHYAPSGFPGYESLASWSEIQYGNVLQQDFVTFDEGDGANVYKLHDRRFGVSSDPSSPTKLSTVVYEWDDSLGTKRVTNILGMNLNASPFPVLPQAQPVRGWSQVLFSNDFVNGTGVLQQDILLGTKLYNRRYVVNGFDKITGNIKSIGNLQLTKIYDWMDPNNPAIGTDVNGSGFPHDTGNIQSWSEVFIPCTPKCATDNANSFSGVLQQDLVRGNHLYNRRYFATVTTVNGSKSIQLTPIYGWSNAIDMKATGKDAFPGAGEVQAWHQFVLNGTYLQQDLWRQDKLYYRRFKIVGVDKAGNVNLQSAGGWVESDTANY